MRATLLPTAALAVVLALAGCTDTGDAPVADVTDVTEDPSWEDVPYVWAEARLPRSIAGLYLIVTSTGSDSVGMIVEQGEDSADVDLQVGETATAHGHTFELLHVDGKQVRLGITDPDGEPISD